MNGRLKLLYTHREWLHYDDCMNSGLTGFS
jgi:hypothetical protein